MVRFDYIDDADIPEKIERYVDYNDVDEDMLRDLAHEAIVRAQCVHCGHSDLYIDWPGKQDKPDCKNSDCDESILLNL